MATQVAPAHSETIPDLTTPTQAYRRTDIVPPKELLKGADAFTNSLVGRYQRRGQVLRRLTRQAQRIDDLAGSYEHLSDRRLRERLAEHRAVFRRQDEAACDAVLEQALAAIREAAQRRVGLRPYVVQIVGALALHHGYLAEMATGEGKTLAAGLAAVLAGWSLRPCHVVTANDYLAQRDAEWMRPLYAFCGVTVAYVTNQMPPEQRRQAYDRHVTYTTSKEVVADFLRDRLVLGPLQNPARRHIRHVLQPHARIDNRLVMRGLHSAIVDEADNILVDEAVTPLIISRQQENVPLTDACKVARDIADTLERGRDYTLNTRYREVEMRPAGLDRIEQQCAALPGIWKGPSRRSELVKQALTAREFFLRDIQYVVQEEEVIIVDEFTGRIMPGRTWREGLHQAIEAKEQMEPTAPSETLARLSFQRYFRLYKRLSGMTGTAKEAAREFWHIYRLPVVAIPTNRPCRRTVLRDRVFARDPAKWQAIAETVADLHRQETPVLVGTRNVAASEKLAKHLDELQLPYNLLNAIHHQEEAQIVAEAGVPGKITIATNMAGRGTDILLGHGVAEASGLHVIATERHEAGRIDRQLFGRCARQGDPGTVHVFVSAEDELLQRFLPAAARRSLLAMLLSRHPAAQASARLAFAYAQRSAQRQAFHQRQQVLRTDTWIDDALAFTGASQFM